MHSHLKTQKNNFPGDNIVAINELIECSYATISFHLYSLLISRLLEDMLRRKEYTD